MIRAEVARTVALGGDRARSARVRPLERPHKHQTIAVALRWGGWPSSATERSYGV